MKKMTRVLSGLLAGVMVLGMTACGAEKKETKAEDTDVMLGEIGALTGQFANYGISVKNGAQIAVDEINEAGLVNGYTFSLKVEDSQGDPDSAVSAFGKLMDDGMDVSLGCTMSGEAASVIATAAKDNILIVTPSSSALNCIEANDKAFRVCFNDAAQGLAAADYIADHKLGSKIAICYQSDNDYSMGLYETFVKQAAERGLEIVEEQTFTEATATDFSTQINAIRSSGCDLVLLPFYFTEAAKFLTQAHGKLNDVVFFGCDGMDGIDSSISDVALLDGLMMLTPFAANAGGNVQNFVEKYQAKYDAIPDQFAADGYDAVYTVKAAMEHCGKTPADEDFTEAMVQAMYEITVEGVTGTMQWGESREPVKEPKVMVFDAEGKTAPYEG